jgi:predicted RNase H-like nuclease (RuvC/YqgF family)
MSDTIFNKTTESVLARGLQAMTKACDALSAENSNLKSDIESLQNQVVQLKDKVVTNLEEKE